MRIDPVPVPRPEQPIRYGALLALFVTVIIVATFGLWVIIVAALHRFSDGLPYQLRDFIGSIILGIILGVAVAAYLHWTDRRRRWKKANADYYHNRVVQLQQSKLTAPGGSVSIQSATPHPPTRPGRSGTIGIGGIGVESPK